MIRGAFPLMAVQMVFIGVSYATQLMLARLLGPEPFGRWAIVLNVASAFSSLLTTGFVMAFSTLIAEAQANVAVIVRSSLRFQAVTLLIVMGLYSLSVWPLSTLMFRDSGLIPYLLAGNTIVAAQTMHYTVDSYLNGLRRFVRQAATTFWSSLGRLAVVAGLVFSGFGIHGAILGYAAGSVVGSLVGWRYLNQPMRG